MRKRISKKIELQEERKLQEEYEKEMERNKKGLKSDGIRKREVELKIDRQGIE